MRMSYIANVFLCKNTCACCAAMHAPKVPDTKVLELLWSSIEACAISLNLGLVAWLQVWLPLVSRFSHVTLTCIEFNYVFFLSVSTIVLCWHTLATTTCLSSCVMHILSDCAMFDCTSLTRRVHHVWPQVSAPLLKDLSSFTDWQHRVFQR